MYIPVLVLIYEYNVICANIDKIYVQACILEKCDCEETHLSSPPKVYVVCRC